MKKLFLLSIGVFTFFSCQGVKEASVNLNQERAIATLDSLYKHYSASGTNLLRENFPFNDAYTATYLASEEQGNVPNQYSYLWPYSGTFSAVNVLYETTKDKKYIEMLDSKVLNGLEEYFDPKREPAAYASYINSASQSDRFYDDNVWLGIDFTDVYMMTKEVKYLDKAKLIWRFIESGMDNELGGGIYWCEQKKKSKNTCSNAPGSVYALKLFMATQDSAYFAQGKFLYEWTKKHLQDTGDYLYFDNINLEGKVDKRKFPYNSGQMLQSAALLYKLTGDKTYLSDAQAIAKSAYNYFFEEFETKQGEKFRILKSNDVWFIAVMQRGFIELYHLDNDRTYIDAFQKSLDYAWNNTRDANGLFNKDWKGEKKDDTKWLLTQAAMVEMYARLAALENK